MTFVSQNNVYIAWTRNPLDVADNNVVDQQIVVSRSTDKGVTFSVPIIINDASISGDAFGNLYADPAVGRNGELYVSWANVNTGQIYFDSSPDAGVSWGIDVLVARSQLTTPKELIDPQPTRGIFQDSMLDVDRTKGKFAGRLYIVYADIGPGGTDGPGGNPDDIDILVTTSIDGGSTWSAPVRVNDDGGRNSQFMPWLDVDQKTGIVATVWYDARNDAANEEVEVFLSASLDGGDTWRANTLVSDNPSDMSSNPNGGNDFLEYIGVAGYKGCFHTAWTDNSDAIVDTDYLTDRVCVDGKTICGPRTYCTPGILGYLKYNMHQLLPGDECVDKKCVPAFLSGLMTWLFQYRCGACPL